MDTHGDRDINEVGLTVTYLPYLCLSRYEVPETDRAGNRDRGLRGPSGSAQGVPNRDGHPPTLSARLTDRDSAPAVLAVVGTSCTGPRLGAYLVPGANPGWVDLLIFWKLKEVFI